MTASKATRDKTLIPASGFKPHSQVLAGWENFFMIGQFAAFTKCGNVVLLEFNRQGYGCLTNPKAKEQ